MILRKKFLRPLIVKIFQKYPKDQRKIINKIEKVKEISKILIKQTLKNWKKMKI